MTWRSIALPLAALGVALWVASGRGEVGRASTVAEPPGWARLVEIDPQNAHLLLQADGALIRPEASLLAALGELSGGLHYAAETYRVDERAVAGCILAENSLNVSIVDGVQDFLVKSKLAPEGSVLGMSFSFGWGQLMLPTVMDVEPLAARIERRPIRDQEEVIEQLVTPIGAIRYVAAILRDAQDAYERHGLDISDRPGVLATLFNVGGARERAAKTRAAGRSPESNYFGFFVEQYLPEIEAALGRTSRRLGGGPSQWMQLPRDATLLRAPPTYGDGRLVANSEYDRISDLYHYGEAGTLAAGLPFEVIENGLGCDLTDWVLVATPDGLAGWIPVSAADDVRAYDEPVAFTAGGTSTSAEHAERALELIGSQLIHTEAPGEIRVRLVGDRDSVDWRSPKFRCPHYGGHKDERMAGSRLPAGCEVLTAAGSREIVEATEEFRSRVVHALGLPGWAHPSNPYRLLSSPLADLADELTRVSEGGAEVLVESRQKDQVILVLGEPISARPSYSALLRIASGLRLSLTARGLRSAEATLSEAVETRRGRLLSSLRECARLAEGLPDSSALLEHVIREAQDAVDGDRVLDELSVEVAERLATQCQRLRTVLGAPPSDRGETADWSIEFELDPAVGTDVVLHATLEDSVVRDLFGSPGDLDRFLMAKLEPLTYGLGRMIPSVAERLPDDLCSYDPFATAALVESLLDLPDVQTVFVPDPWLVKRLAAHGSRVIYRPFLEDDRFALRLVGSTGDAERR